MGYLCPKGLLHPDETSVAHPPGRGVRGWAASLQAQHAL